MSNQTNPLTEDVEQQMNTETTESKSNRNNSVVLQGQIAKPLQLKTSANGKNYINVPLQIERNFENLTETDTYYITFFGEKAEEIAKIEKGANVYITGRINQSTYNNKTTLSIIGGKFESTDSKDYKNSFTLSGFVNNNNLELKTSEKGNKSNILALSVKNDNEDSYNTFFIKSFGKTAEKICYNYKKNDLINLSGVLEQDNEGRLSIVAYRSELIRSAKEIKAKKEEQQRANEQEKAEKEID